MIENQINMIVAITYCKRILPAYKGKSLSQFQQECLQIINQFLFQVMFTIVFPLRKAKEFKCIGTFDNIFRLLNDYAILCQLQNSFFIPACRQTEKQRTIYLTTK